MKNSKKYISIFLAVVIIASSVLNVVPAKAMVNNPSEEAVSTDVNEECALEEDGYEYSSKEYLPEAGGLVDGIDCVDEEAAMIDAISELLAANPDDEGVAQLFSRDSSLAAEYPEYELEPEREPTEEEISDTEIVDEKTEAAANKTAEEPKPEESEPDEQVPEESEFEERVSENQEYGQKPSGGMEHEETEEDESEPENPECIEFAHGKSECYESDFEDRVVEGVEHTCTLDDEYTVFDENTVDDEYAGHDEYTEHDEYSVYDEYTGHENDSEDTEESVFETSEAEPDEPEGFFEQVVELAKSVFLSDDAQTADDAQAGDDAQTAEDAQAADDAQAAIDAQVSYEALDLSDEVTGAVLMASGSDEDKQHGEAITFVPASTKAGSMAYVSGFVLSGMRDGAGDWDDRTDLLGYDSSDKNKVVRTQDDLTYYMSYSTALNEQYEYKTISGAKLYLQYTLNASQAEAVFNLEAMPWLKGNATGDKPVIKLSNNGKTQTLIGYRDLPDKEDEYGSYDVPGAGTVNCVIHVLNMKSGAQLQPVFKAWIEAVSNTSAPAYAETAVAGTNCQNTTVTVSTGAYIHLSINADTTTIAEYGSYTGLSLNGSNVTFSGRLKGFKYKLTAGKMNGRSKGTSPLKAGSDIRVYFNITSEAIEDPDGTESALWAVKTLGTDTQDALGHANSEYPGLEKYYTSQDPGYGHASAAAVSGGQYSFLISGFTGVNPGDVISEGLIVCSQRMPSTGPRTYHYKTTVTCKKATMTADDGLGARSVSLETSSGSGIYPAASHENAVTPPGSYNITVHLKGTEKNEKGKRVALSVQDTSTANIIGYGKEFYVTANNTNILYEEAQKIHAFNQYILWDNRYVEPVISGGKLDAEIYSMSGWSGYYYDETHPVRFITKKDGTVWADETEMKQASLKTYDDLRFYKDYSSVPSGWKICGILVEGRTLRNEVLNTDNIHGIEFRMKTVSQSSAIDKVAMFTQSVDAYLNPQGTLSRAGTNGIGSVMPDGDRVSYKMGARTYDKTEWNADGSISSSSLTTHNTVYEGNSVLIKGYTCTVDLKHEDGSETKTLDLGTVTDAKLLVRPFLDSSGLHTKAPETILKITLPEGLSLISIRNATKGTAVNLNTTYSLGGTITNPLGKFKATKTEEGVRIVFTNTYSDYDLPEFEIKYGFDPGILKNDASLTIEAAYTGDGKALDKINGNLADIALRIVETETSVLKETVDKAYVKNGETLTYTISYLNSSGDNKTLNLSCPKPSNGDADGTSFSGSGSLAYVSASAVGNRGSSLSANMSGSTVKATGTLKPGEEATITIVYSVQGAENGDVIRNHCQQVEDNGTIISNLVETLVKFELPLEIKKAVDRVSNDLGEKHTWTVDASVPEDISADNGSCEYFIEDKLDPRLSYEGNVEVSCISGTVVTVMRKGTDYTLTEPTTAVGGTLKVTMLNAGIRKLENADSVRLKFMTSINTNASVGVHIPNKAGLTFKGFGYTKTVLSNEPYVYTGQLTVVKKDSSTSNLMRGVTFKLYRIESGGSETEVQRNGSAFTAVTGTNGKAVFAGLKDGTYKVVETKTVPGHQLLSTGVEVIIEQGQSQEITIVNPDAPHLLAGGEGDLKTIIRGLSLLLLAFLLYTLQRNDYNISN